MLRIAYKQGDPENKQQKPKNSDRVKEFVNEFLAGHSARLQRLKKNYAKKGIDL